MNYRIYFTSSLLAVSIFLPDRTPAAVPINEFSLSSNIASNASPTSSQNWVSAKPIVVTELIEQLRTADAGKRLEIIQQLTNTQRDIVPELIQAMSDPDPLVKSAVAEVLGNLTDAAVPAIPALVEMTSSTQRAILPLSPQGLLSLPDVPEPIPLPASSTPSRRIPPNPPQNPENMLKITAIAALGKIGLPARTAATPALTQALQDSNPWVKLNATWALSEIGASTPLLAYWLEAIQHPNPELRRSAAEIFDDFSSLLPKVFGSEANASTTAPLLTVLGDEDYKVRYAAKRGLKLLGTKALPGLVQSLKSPEPLVRLEAAQLLGDLGTAAQSAVPELVRLLQDTERYISPESKRGIPLLLLPPLHSTSKHPSPPNNPERLVRANASIALGYVGDRKAIPALTNALKDNNPWMRLATAWALLRLEQNQGFAVIGRLIENPNVNLSYQALTILEHYGAKSAPYLLPYYKAQLDSTDNDKRNNAIIGIGNMGVASLDLVPKLRTILNGNKKHSPGYSATTLGKIALDTASAWQNRKLSPQQRRQAIVEFTKVLRIMQAPNARFNQEPRERIHNAINTLSK